MTPPFVSCPACATGTAATPGDVLLATTDRWTTITLVCHNCGRVTARPVDPQVRQALEPFGIAAVELLRAHPEHPPVGPPLTRDDLLDLHVLLQAEAWFAQLEGEVAA